MFEKSQKYSAKEAPSEQQRLLNEYFSTLSKLHQSRAAFEHATDPELVNVCVYEMNALQQKYSYLLQKIREEKLSCPISLRSQ